MSITVEDLRKRLMTIHPADVGQFGRDCWLAGLGLSEIAPGPPSSMSEVDRRVVFLTAAQNGDVELQKIINQTRLTWKSQ